MIKQKILLTKVLFLILALFVITACFFVAKPTNVLAKADEKDVYLGGQPIGLNIFSEGLIVLEYKPIITVSGTCSPAKDGGLLIGDMIIKAEDTITRTPKDLQTVIDSANESVHLSVKRSSEVISIELKPVFDPIAGAKKLGIIVKNDISGVGTVTYVEENGNFCSLGHKIADPNLNNHSLYQSGKVYSANILGVYKGSKDEAGALKGTFDKTSKEVGKINKNYEFGVYGNLADKSFYSSNSKIKIGSKNDVKPGKAYIYTTIDGNKPQKYQIEIVKAYQQNTQDTKSMVIRVTDKNLLEKSGGIVQGMSGSPIIQNDRLIGAVTHVFLNDSTIGYGVYIDWLN